MESIGNVVFIPGITGSTLSASPIPQTSPWAGKPIWVDTVNLINCAAETLKLNAGGDGPISGNPALIPGRPYQPFYGSFLGWLGEQGFQVYVSVADWRRKMEFDASQVLPVIERAVKDADAPCYVVCHSRGGLVMRTVLETLKADGHLDWVKRVVGLCCPHTGAFAGAQLLAATQTTASTLQTWKKGGGDPRLVQGIISTWPSAYELLPKPNAPGWKPSDISNLYATAWWATAGLTIDAEWLADARTHWTALPAFPPTEVEWVSVYGLGVPTPDALIPGKKITDTGSLHYSHQGDGAVMAFSAFGAGGKKISFPASHEGIIRDNRLWKRIKGLILNGLTEDETVDGSIVN